MFEERVEKILQKLKVNRFYPFPFARSGYLQTIFGVYWPHLKAPLPQALHHVELPDGDRLLLAENRPEKWQPGDRVVLLVHGLTGSHQSNYMQRMCRRLYFQDRLVLRLNLRGCGPGFGLSRNPYHCGVSDDARHVLRWIAQRYPQSPVTQIGFSLGGNITLKMAGEDGSCPSGNLDSVVAVSPPLDLARSVEKISRPENWVFQNYFLTRLKAEVRRLHARFPELGDWKFPEKLSVREFDELYTAPRCGFKDADDYYKKSSALGLLSDIRVPALIVSSADDPVVALPEPKALQPAKSVDVLITEHGGHVGFLGWGTTWDEIRWSDQTVSRWLDETVA